MTDNPYQATASSTPVAAKSNDYVFRSLKPLAIAVTAMMIPLLICFFAVSAIETIAGSMFPSFSDPNADVSSELELNYVYASLAFGGLAGLLQLAIAVPVCMFLYRANANLRALGVEELEYTPGWCAGWWFVPIMNLFKPYGATKNLSQNLIFK